MTPPNDIQADKTLRDLSQVLEISRAMVAARDLDELLQLIIARSLQLLDVERATLFLCDATRNELVSRIATGVEEIRVSAEKGFCGAVVRTGQTLIIPDAYADPRFNPDVDRTTGFRTRNILSIPLHDYEGELVGVLQALNKRGGAFTEYDVTLGETLGAQAGVAIQRATLIEHYLQKKEMERAMQIARDIQRGLLPTDSPAIAGFDVAGLSEPADETGGDTYDFIPLPNGQWAFAVADATGHGIGPALVIAETRAMLRASAHLCKAAASSVSHILNTVNHLLAADLGGGTFVTCFLGILDPQNATLTYASAGHGPMIFYNRREDRFHQIPATSVPLGVLDDSDYSRTNQFRFESGDFAIISTDGVFEAFDPQGEMFGVRRMLERLRADRDATAAEMIASLYRTVGNFTADAKQADDITAIALKRTENESTKTVAR